MARTERIKRKPEYDAEDWEAVGKLKEYVEGLGFSFKETGSRRISNYADCLIRWMGSYAREVGFCKTIPGIVELLKNVKHLTAVRIHSTVDDLHWLCELRGIQHLYFQDFNTTIHMVKFRGLDSWASAETIRTVFFDRLLYVPTFIRKFQELRTLAFSQSSIPLSLPDWIAELPELERLMLAGRIQSIPYSLVKTRIPFVTDMQELPSDRRYILLDGVMLEEGDISLFSQSREVIEAYYRGREDRARQSVRECKVIFLGKGGAGKSSLIQRMEFPEQELDPNSLPTNGVSVTKWNVTAPDGPMSLRVMDFGGQEIMHSMHRCFLTAHTVYVVVCDSREDGGVDAEAVMWVEAVKTFAPDCPVILALNKADLSGNVSVNTKDLKRRNPNLKTVLRTSALVAPNHSGYGVGLLEEAILREVPGCMDRMEVSPEWLAVKRELEDMVEKDIDTFTAADYREICIRHNTGGDDALRFKMLEYFKTIGVAYFYNPTDGAPDYSLESIRVSNPAWITNGIYRLIIKADDIGFLPKREIREILKTPYDGETLPGRIYDGEKADFILHVMRMFHISMPFGKDTELVPMKMPKEPPDSADDYPFGKAIHLRWEASYLPDNLVHRLIIDMSRNLYEGPDGHYCVWRRGARFRRNGCDALSRMDDKGLDAFVYGADSDAARAYMENFRETVAGILLDLHIDAA